MRGNPLGRGFHSKGDQFLTDWAEEPRAPRRGRTLTAVSDVASGRRSDADRRGL
jgi:hypothetical protein